MRTRRDSWSLALILILWWRPVWADGATTVNCGSNSANLQRTIDQAAPGTTIVVRGTCATNGISIRKDLQLVGAEGAALSATNTDRVLYVSGSTVSISNLRINAASANFGIIAEEGASVLIDRVQVENAANGIGIAVFLNSHASVTGSTLRGNLYGMMLNESSSTWFVDNRIEQSGYAAMAVLTSSTADIINSVLTAGNIGVLAGRFSGATLTNSQITNNTGPGFWLTPFYAAITLRPELSTIQNNGADAKCDDRAIIEVQASQISSTKTTDLQPGCVIVGGPLFQ